MPHDTKPERHAIYNKTSMWPAWLTEFHMRVLSHSLGSFSALVRSSSTGYLVNIILCTSTVRSSWKFEQIPKLLLMNLKLFLCLTGLLLSGPSSPHHEFVSIRLLCSSRKYPDYTVPQQKGLAFPGREGGGGGGVWRGRGMEGEGGEGMRFKDPKM